MCARVYPQGGPGVKKGTRVERSQVLTTQEETRDSKGGATKVERR